MATRSEAAGKKTSTGSTYASAGDAIALLTADHAAVKKCFHSYQKLVDAQADASKREALAEQIRGASKDISAEIACRLTVARTKTVSERPHQPS